MGFGFSKINRYLYIPTIFLLIFLISATLFIKRQEQLDHSVFANHAAIISDDIWALNDTGATTYLRLAMDTNHYKSVHVSIPGEDNFLRLEKESLNGLSALLFKAGLIRTKTLSEVIQNNGQTIGVLNATQYVQVVYPLFNILIAQLLILLTIVFIISLFLNRRYLEEEVEIRTRSLRSSEQRFHDLVNFLPEIVLETNISGNITYANRVAVKQLPLDLDSGEGFGFLEVLRTTDRHHAQKSFYSALRGETTDLLEYAFVSKEQKNFPVLLKMAPLFNNEMVIGGARMVAIDITSRRKLEKELVRDQKMKAIGLMAGGVAHDLNNILSGIVSYPELLLLQMQDQDPLYKPLQSIRQSGLDAAEVVSDLLTVARGVAASTEVVSLNDLIRKYLESPDFDSLIRHYPDTDIITNLEDDLRPVNCSPIHVRKCLMNIINNGVESMKKNGTLTISTENVTCSLPVSKIKTGDSAPQDVDTSPKDYSKIIISDTGEGIDQDELPHIFEPFYSTKVMGRSGTGLGLTIVWNTIRDHGGTVSVSSSETGTSFELYFPSFAGEFSQEPERENLKHFIGNGERILVVDDEKRQRDILKSILNSLKYNATTVASGEEAEQYVKQNDVDLIVLDMVMPPGQNGRVTYENIRRFKPGQKAIIASGFARDDDVQAVITMGASDFVPKPYTIEQIGAVIHKTLHP